MPTPGQNVEGDDMGCLGCLGLIVTILAVIGILDVIYLVITQGLEGLQKGWAFMLLAIVLLFIGTWLLKH